ncbi:hypothetical protein CASFOL_036992 [Castilleja foliolosa]|uniref:F-box domain-containing protein n=1 Tax=Castilleja foliolosa TaxID=1961234 RepID=A0ABD3BQ97_9LAMI
MGSNAQKLCSDDLIFEILTRTSLRTLDTCKCVSKNWYNLIYESDFKPTYCHRTNNLAGYFIQNRDDNISLFVEMPEKDNKNSNKIDKFPNDIKILASCNQGLLYCINERTCRYYVCKPATRQWQPLPNPKLGYLANAVAIMVLGSTPLRYKIICLYDNIYNPVTRAEIFDSKCWSWRRLRNIDRRWNDITLSFYPAIRVGKSVHWLTEHPSRGVHTVLSFHEPDESFARFSLSQSSKRLVNYKGKLGVIKSLEKYPDRVMQLWVKYNDRWTLEMVVSLSRIIARNLKWPRLIDFYDTDIVFIESGSEGLFYKLEDRSVRKVFKVSLDKIRYRNVFFEFRSDWEPVDLRGGRLLSYIRRLSIKTLMCS